MAETQGAQVVKGILLGNPALVGLDLNQSGIMGTGVAHIAVGACCYYVATVLLKCC